MVTVRASMMCQIARVVILLTAYARDHGEAWPYVASLTELMCFIAADRNDMVGEAAAAAPSERVLEELARLGAMLQSALRVQTYRDRHDQLCEANDAVVAAAAFVRSLDPVVTPAKTLTSSADDTLAAGRRGSLVNDTTATAESGRETTSVHHGAGGDDHFEGDERAVANGHRRASPGDRRTGAGGPEGVPASLEPTRPDAYPSQVTMCDCEWQIAEAVENGCKYHKEMQDNGQEHYERCPAVGGGGFVGSDCSSDATVGAERVNAADAERPAAEEAAHGGARSKLENARQVVRSLDPVVISAAANAEVSTCVETSASMPPVDPTPSADVCNCVECSFHIVIAEGSSTMREFMFTSLLWAFGTRTQDDQSLSPTIVHMEPNGSEYVEFAVHGYINIEGRRVESIDAFIWRFIDNLRGFYLHCDIMRRTRPQCGDVFKHFKTAVRRYDGNQFNEEFQSYCNLNTALELAGLFSDMCSRSDDRSAAYGEARRYGFVPRNQEQCTCASCVSVC